MLRAVIFDFDGIIVDTEPLHYKAFQDVLVPLGLGYSWDEYIRRYIGYDDRDAFREVFRSNGRQLGGSDLRVLIEEKGAAFQRCIGAGLEPYPGVVELVGAIAGTLPLGLCSGALPSDILPILRQLNIENSFDAIVTAEDVAASKPDPASYALAVARLDAACTGRGVTAGTCLAIEDTPAGIASATGAGLKALAVTNSYPEESLAGAVKVIDSLAGVDLAGLRLLFQD
jgi:beta-phosphoglucomutase